MCGIVALHASAWIETETPSTDAPSDTVALHASAWIETQAELARFFGLSVALHASAWIEKWKEIKSKNEKDQSLKLLRSLLHPYSMRVM